MISDSYGDQIKPGPSSFAACMLSAMKTEAWEDILRLNQKMKECGILPTEPEEPTAWHRPISTAGPIDPHWDSWVPLRA